jgi:hypothetical protein
MASINSTPVWRKSSRSSDPELAQCVEVATVGVPTTQER